MKDDFIQKTIPALVIFALSNAVAYANDFDKSNEAMAISAIGFLAQMLVLHMMFVGQPMRKLINIKTNKRLIN
ncbi:hypothetical protein M8494_05930 [Serratia ureilytica]